MEVHTNNNIAAECFLKGDKQLKCSICIDTYTQPRYLPTCGHTFCEKCIFSYTREAQQGTQGSNFRCPVCRKPHDLPENSEVTLQWVQKFALNTVIIKMIEAAESTADSTSEELKDEQRTCHPCEADGEVKVGVKFCFDCKEILCIDCTKFHKKFKTTKGHNLADIETMSTKDFDVDVLNAVCECMTHERQELDVYCKMHAVFICMYCMSADHKACNVVPSSSPDIDVSTLREESEKVNKQIKAMLEHIDHLQTLRGENKNNIKLKLKKIRDSAEHARDQVVQLMDNVVKHVAEVTKQVDYETEHTLDESVSRISKIKHQIEQKHTILDTIGKLGSDKHKYISSQQIKEQCVEIETQIIEEDKRLKVIDAELKLADDIRKMLECTEVEKLIELNMKQYDSDHRWYGVEPNPAWDIGAEEKSTRNSKLVNVDETLSECSLEPEKKPEEFVFGSSGASAFSFSSLAAPKETFKTDGSKPFPWQRQDKQLFGAGGGAEGGGSGNERDVAAGDDPYFKPIVPLLPDLVDVKTGEEEETAQFSNRAKLFRFDKDTNQWKEKGIGKMKILRHNTTGAYRLLLRREQVHKLACNHRLTPKLTLKPMTTSETAWCWIAQDFSDTEHKIERLAVKFKTIELAKTFKDKFEEIQSELRAYLEDD